MSTQGREATQEDSKLHGDRRGIPPLSGLLGGIALAGALLTVAAAFSTVIRVRLNTVEVASYSGLDRHSVALPLLGLLGLLMLLGAVRGARPAIVALGLAGVAVLLIAVLIDLPHLNDSGIWPQRDLYEADEAVASKGPGYLLELAGGVFMAFSAVALFVLGPRRLGAAAAGDASGAPRTPPPPPAPAQIGSGTPVASAPPAAVEPPAPAPSSTPSPSVPSTPTIWERIPSSAHPTEEQDPFAPRARPPAKRRSGGLVGKLRRRG